LELEEEVDDIISRNDPIPIHHPRRRFLLFSSVGEQCLDTVERFWLRDTDDDGASKAEFDIVLVFYAQTTSSQVYDRLKEIAQKNRGFMTLIARKDFKWPNFRWWVFESGRVSRSHHDSTQLSEEGNGGSNTIRSSIKALKSKYEAIWVPDDDMRMSTTDINNLFHVVLRHPNILIASPSFTPTSEGVWRYHDVHQGANTLLRYTNFVENSAALLRPAVLEDEMFRRCLEAVISGCYLDFCFFAAVGYSEERIAIVDTSICMHPHRSEETKSELVRELGMDWKDHWKDMESFDHHNVPRDVYWWRQPVVFDTVKFA